MASPLAVCFGCAGLTLTDEERRFFHATDPLGFILFARNIDSPEQVRTLVRELRDSVGRENAPVLIDQEGGRVQRLKEPHWRSTPAPALFVRLHDLDADAGLEATRLNARLIADDLFDLGIDVNCLPVLDIPAPGSHPFLHDRAAGLTVDQSVALGRMDCDGLLDGGVLPVIKHIPGHGRGTADSHEAMPHINALRSEMDITDFAPFRALKDCPWAMTAHVVYSDIDPEHPATTSSIIINDVIRTDIGFDGFLISDDVSMGALAGPLGVRTSDSIEAGCDAVLHCNGVMAEMAEVADHSEILSDRAMARFTGTLTLKQPPRPLDRREAEHRLEALLSPARESV